MFFSDVLHGRVDADLVSNNDLPGYQMRCSSRKLLKWPCEDHLLDHVLQLFQTLTHATNTHVQSQTDHSFNQLLTQK